MASQPQLYHLQQPGEPGCCMEFGISRRPAALQFPLGHPAVVSVIPGARSAAELQQNLAALRETHSQRFLG